MRKPFSVSIFAMLLGGIVAGYDLKTAELTPVSFRKPPRHRPVEMIVDGKIDFVIAADLQAEARMRSRNKTEPSIAPALQNLQEAFLRCTGIAPEIKDISEVPAESKLIVVGDCGVARRNGVDVRGLPSQGFAVKTFSRGVVLAGDDSSLIAGYNMEQLEKRGSSTGTKYAVYDFIERFLGVRYYFPGEYGTLWPQVRELTLQPVHYEDAPYFRQRSGVYYLSITLLTPEAREFWEPYLGKTTEKDVRFWDRWRMGSTEFAGGTHCPDPKRIARTHFGELKTIFYTSPSGNFWYNPKQHVGNYFDVVNLDFADILIGCYKRFYGSGGRLDDGGFGGACSRDTISFGMCDTLMPYTDVVDHTWSGNWA